MTLRSRSRVILLLLGAAVLVLTVLMPVLVVRHVSRELEEHIEASVSAELSAANNAIVSADSKLATAASFPLFKYGWDIVSQYSTSTINQATTSLYYFFAYDPEFRDGLYLLDANCSILWELAPHTLSPEDLKLIDSRFDAHFASSAEKTSAVIFINNGESHRAYIAHQIKSESGITQGYFLGDITSYLSDTLLHHSTLFSSLSVNLEKSHHPFLMNASGEVFVPVKTNNSLKRFLTKATFSAISQAQKEKTEGTLHGLFGGPDSSAFVVYSSIADGGIILADIDSISKKAYLLSTPLIWYMLGVLTLLVSIGMLIVLYFLRLIKPLDDLTQQALQIAEGNLTTDFCTEESGEVGVLASALSAMKSELATFHEQLPATEKLAALGQMSASIAHELNNPMAIIKGNIELLEMEAMSLSKYDPEMALACRMKMEKIKVAVSRSSAIISSLLSFSRRDAFHLVPTELNGLIQESLQFFEFTNKKATVQVQLKLGSALIVEIDPTQLQQVVINLLTNAAQALSHSPQPRTIIVATGQYGNDSCFISVSDNGPGIDSTLHSKVFEPFFTTKDVGKGTGLGLSICHGIVSRHGGSITLDSKPGNGASFVVRLPLHAKSSSCGINPVPIAQ